MQKNNFMHYIANILTDKNFPEDNLYNIVNNLDNVNPELPTLIIGWEYTKKLFPSADILNWKIDKNIFWTYGKREKNQRYIETINKFKEYAVKCFIKSIKYNFTNILVKQEGIENLITLLKFGQDLNVFINNDLIYINHNKNNVVYGYSLREVEYGGGNKKAIFAALYSNKDIKFIENKDLSSEIRTIFNNYLYVIPCLL